MKARKPRKPTLRKYPQKPKASASNQAKERYLARVKEVDKENAARKKDYEAALKSYEHEKKRASQLSQQIASIGKPGYAKSKTRRSR